MWEPFGFSGAFLPAVMALPSEHFVICYQLGTLREISGPMSRSKVEERLSDMLTPVDLTMV